MRYADIIIVSGGPTFEVYGPYSEREAHELAEKLCASIALPKNERVHFLRVHTRHIQADRITALRANHLVKR